MSEQKLPIEVDGEGLPTDKALRAVVLRIRSFDIRGEYHLKHNLRRLVHRHLPHLAPHSQRELDRVEGGGRRARARRRFWLRQLAEAEDTPEDLVGPAVDALIASMLATGRLLRSSEGMGKDGTEIWEYRFPNRRSEEKTPEARAANWKAAVDGIVQRVSEDKAVQERARTLFLQARNLYKSHPVVTNHGHGVVVPQGFELTAQGPVITSAVLFTDAPGGVQVRTGTNISVVWNGVEPVVTVGKGFRISRSRTRRLAEERLSPRSPYRSQISEMSFVMRKGARYFKGRKHLVSEMLGENLDDLRWRKFLKAIQKASDLQFMIASHIFKMLDPEARRAALRDPFATFSTYAWYRCVDQEAARRRRQASQSYPFATGRLSALEEKIDAGEPLAEPVASLFGMTAVQLRALGTLHWQRLGRVVHDMKHFRENDFRGVPPERMPRTKKEWAAHMGKLAGFRRKLTPELAALFNRAASNDPTGYAALLGKDLEHAIWSTVCDLQPLMTGVLRMRPDADWRAHMAFLSLIGGDSFGLKRLRRFNEQWHAGTLRRTAALQARRKKAFNGHAARWRPLVEGDFVSENGRLRFLVNEDELVAEGKALHHCVGSYVQYCVAGYSHIAAVEGARGGRSTVEVTISNGRLRLAQHHTYYDRRPPEDCEAAVADFLSSLSSETFEVVPGQSGRDGYGVSVEADEETLAELRELFSDCVPTAVLALDKEQWKEIMEKFETAPPCAQAEEDEAYDGYY